MNTKNLHKNVIIIDNYDSFTYNLVHMVEDLLGFPITVKRNDEIHPDALEDFDYILLSPGPGVPDEAGQLKNIIRRWGKSKNVFGVCLGLQAIGEVYGASLMNLDKVYHGVSTSVLINDSSSPIFREIPTEIEAGRYHSWVIDPETVPDILQVTATDEGGQIMAAQHKAYSVYGVQFHPESIMTPLGKKIMENFLELPVKSSKNKATNASQNFY